MGLEGAGGGPAGGLGAWEGCPCPTAENTDGGSAGLSPWCEVVGLRGVCGGISRPCPSQWWWWGGSSGRDPAYGWVYTMANLSLEGAAQARSMVAVGRSYTSKVYNLPHFPPSSTHLSKAAA
jgi:hypothetical protein